MRERGHDVPVNEKTGQNLGFRHFHKFSRSRTAASPITTGVWKNSVLIIYIYKYIYILGFYFLYVFSRRLEKICLFSFGQEAI